MNELTKNTLNVEQLKDLQQRFLQYMDNSPKTMQTYEIALRQFFKYLKEKNIKIATRENIIDYKNELKETLKPTTVNGYLIAIKSFFKWLEYESLYKNITENIKTLKFERRHLKRGLTVDEVSLLLKKCIDIREKLLLTLTLTCALRSNEVTNIRLQDFYEEDNATMLRILGKGKESKQDSVKIDNRVYDLIKEYCKEYKITDYLFTSTSNNNKGGKINTITIRRIFNAICERANINTDRISYHSCRHFSATQSLKNGLSLQEVSESLRHSQISTTQIYIDEINQVESKFSNILSNIIFDK